MNSNEGGRDMSAHTQGPFSVTHMLSTDEFEGSAKDVLLISSPRADFAYVAHVSANGDTAEQKANAALIAAAPELLEACKAAQKYLLLPEGQRGDVREILQLLGKAGIKAEGNT
jgi:hypothetical protein